MHLRSLILFPFLVLLITLNSCKEKLQDGALVQNATELQTAISNAKAGDEIIMADGIWSDLKIEFLGEGNKENPITLRAETPGKVFIEGESFLKIRIPGSMLSSRD